MKDSKNLVIGMLCAVVCIMAVAYAAFSTTLQINGTASIESNWCVQIKDAQISCTETPVAGGAAGSVTASGTRNSSSLATISMEFTQPGDTATCTVVFENCGTLAAKMGTLTITGTETSGPIRFTVDGLTESTKLAPKGQSGATQNVTVTGTYDSSVEEQPTTTSKTVTISAQFVQDTAA